MIFILLGVVAILMGVVLGTDPRYKENTSILKGLGILAICVGIFYKCIVTVKPGEIGVQVLFGRVNVKNVLDNGLHIINPLVDVVKFDGRTQNYTMSGLHDEGEKSGDDAIRVLSNDGLEITIDLSILYRVKPSSAPFILKEIGQDYKEKIIRPVTRTRIRDNAVYYQAIDLYSYKRDEFQNKIFKSIEKDFDKRGLVLEQILVRNITLPESVKKSIEGKINAEQESQKMQFVLAKEKQEAERKQIEAQGIADYQRIINIGLTDHQIAYEQIKALKELAKSDNSKIIIMGNGKGPILLGTGQ